MDLSPFPCTFRELLRAPSFKELGIAVKHWGEPIFGAMGRQQGQRRSSCRKSFSLVGLRRPQDMTGRNVGLVSLPLRNVPSAPGPTAEISALRSWATQVFSESAAFPAPEATEEEMRVAAQFCGFRFLPEFFEFVNAPVPDGVAPRKRGRVHFLDEQQ
jgi:hypothetical protein